MSALKDVTPRPEVRILALSRVRIDGGTQARAGLDPRAVEEYAEAMLAGEQLPPGVVFYDGRNFWLADGFHRTAAGRAAGIAALYFEVREGSQRDAVLYAVGANARHGVRRTDEDKRRAVGLLLGDPEWSKWSDNEIARRVRVSKTTVGKLRVRLDPGAATAPRLARRGDQVYEIRPGAAVLHSRDWLFHLARFTAEQFLHWQKIVDGRADKTVAAEAVAIVVREANSG